LDTVVRRPNPYGILGLGGHHVFDDNPHFFTWVNSVIPAKPEHTKRRIC
jgi:hypothetical protein